MMNKRKEPEGKTKQWPTKFAAQLVFAGAVTISVLSFAAAQTQKPLPPLDPASNPHRTRLILKDGSYQVIMSYRVVGNIVRYVSAERGGEVEEIPADLVDFEATRRWEKQHSAPAAAADSDSGSSQAPPIDPELLKEEADRAALTPEVAKDLRLPEQDSTLILDNYQDTPELVPLGQTEGDLNRNTGHNVVRAAINPLSSSHQLVQIKGERAAVQLHIDAPVLFIRLDDATAVSTGTTPLTVDTHGASSSVKSAPGVSPNSRYVIVRADVRTGLRVISSFKVGLVGSGQRQEDVVETTAEILPGGHWMKLTPRQSLSFGEYALMEVISDKDVNLGVWDFGIHPVAPENRDVIKPEPKRPLSLERHRPD